MTTAERPTAGAHASEAHLESGQLGRGALVSLSLASFFPAVGIALAPLLVLSTAGPTAWQSSLLATLALVFVGRSVIAFARRYVATGSLYSYIGEVFGPWARYLTGAALLAGFATAIGALAGVFGIFTGSFLLSRGMANALQPGPQLVIFVVAIGISAAVAFRGLDTSVLVAVTLAVLSVPLVLVITVASVVHTGFDLSTQLDFGSFSISGTLEGIALGAAFLVGFESCAALAAETRDPKRNVPLAVMAVPVVLGGLFPLVTLMQVPGLLGASDNLAAGMSAPAALALESGLGSTVASASDVVLAAATFAALIGFVNYGSRFVLTLGEGGLMPTWTTKVHPRFHSPYAAIALMSVTGFAIIAALLLLTGDVVSAYYTVAPLIVYVWVVPYVLICLGAIVLTVRGRERRPGLVITSVLGAVAMAWTYANGLINPPAPPADTMSWVVLVVLAAVFLFIVLTRRLNRRSEVEPLPLVAAEVPD